DGDIQTTDAIDFVIVDFREDDLLTHAHGVVTTTVERFSVQATEVTDTRYGDANQPFQELPHTLATQGYFTTYRVAFTNLEARNRFASFGDQRLLTGNGSHIGSGIFQQLFVRDRFTN